MMEWRSDISVSSRPTALERMVSAKTADRARPSLLARYMAASASRSSDSGSTEAEIARAMPALADRTRSPPSPLKGSFIAERIRSATASDARLVRQAFAQHDEFIAAHAGKGVLRDAPAP